MEKLAVLMTSHNRKAQTLACLESIVIPDHLELDTRIFQVDDGSTDGTAAAVREQWPDVVVIEGDGNLYWSRGMARAWQAARADHVDYYLWLNDDVSLQADAVERLVREARRRRAAGEEAAILIGSLSEPGNGGRSYGGMMRTRWWHPGTFRPVAPSADDIVPVDTFNGNLVLVPAEVSDRVGIVDGSFSHALGDVDYGLRAKAQGIPNLLAPGLFGVCSRGERPPLSWRSFRHPKGLPPADWLTYTRRHGPCLLWAASFISPYVRLARREMVAVARARLALRRVA